MIRLRFGWKHKALAAEAEVASLKLETIALKNQVDYLVRTLRDMDDKIFSMGQCSSWPSMQPRFLALHDEMTARKVAESKRIGTLIERELHSTYDPNDWTKTKKLGK